MFVTPATLLVLVNLVYSQKPSPCPQIFSYKPQSQEQDRWYGNITLKAEEPLDEIWLKITIDKPAQSFGSWFGEVTSDNQRELKIKKTEYYLEKGASTSVRFFVKYNPASSIPSLTSIRLNGVIICNEEKKTQSTTSYVKVTSTTPKTHSSRPTTGRPLHNNTNFNHKEDSRPNVQNIQRNAKNNRQPSEASQPSSNQGHSNDLLIDSDSKPQDVDYFPGDFAFIQSNHARPILGPQVLNQQNKVCGTVVLRARPLISHGQNTSQGQWPWHAAIYYIRRTELTYTCGGTLVSEEHVITAAHCVTIAKTSRQVDKNILVVYLGKYSLRKFGTDVQDVEISQIFVHPEYNARVYFNDIAILKLKTYVKITNFVRPCCLWEDKEDLEPLFNKVGTVVGWGFNENQQISENLLQAEMPIAPTDRCIWSNRAFFSQFSNEKNYCAGFENGTTVCNGDSGGGMVFPKFGTSSTNTVWQLRGIVSVGVALQTQGTCDTSYYSLFTDVAKYLDWIKHVMDS